MRRPNILVIMTDEHDPSAMGCYGHSLVRTPHLDRLAREGVVFDNAYCNSPMCVPSRMSFLTGQLASQVSVYDNGSPLASEAPTYAHYLQAAGYETVLCGRMHMIGPDRLHGFGLRLYDDMTRWTRYEQKPDRAPRWRRGSNSHVTECGPGDGAWLAYDRTAIDLAERYLRVKADASSSEPWMLTVGLMYPHFPLWVPPRYYDQYPLAGIQVPYMGDETFESQHPVIQHLRYAFRNERDLPDDLTRMALASYYGLITMTDEQVGRLLSLVEETRLQEDTVVIYASDHGEMAGQHGIWQKQCFYEAAVRVPLIVKDPRGRRGARISANASLVDLVPTLLDLAGLEPPDGLVGRSLRSFVAAGVGEDRAVVSEYHAQGMLSGGFMVKKERFKYNHYVGHEPQLFDLEADPDERKDIAREPAYGKVLADLRRELYDVLDPEETDARAKANQRLEGIRRACG